MKGHKVPSLSRKAVPSRSKGRATMSRPGKPVKKGSAFVRSAASSNPNRKLPSKDKGDRINSSSNLRDKSTIKRINMYTGGAPVRNKKGQIVHGGAYADRNQTGGRDITKMTGRTAPNRKWFGNTRVVGQAQLDKFREEITAQVHDPYQVILRQAKVPMGLISDVAARSGGGDRGTSSTSNMSANERKQGRKVARMNLLTSTSYEDTFGPKRTRKRPKLSGNSLAALVRRECSLFSSVYFLFFFCVSRLTMKKKKKKKFNS